MAEEKGILATLFDLSFDTFITKRVIKFLYALAIIGSILLGLLFLFSGFGMFKYNILGGFFMILFSPIITFLILLYSRVFLEITMVFFKIEENTAKLLTKDSKSIAEN